MSFWESLPRPFSVLAPMEDVTDTVFRQTMLVAGRPDVFFTEFTSVDGIDYALRSEQNTALAATRQVAPLRADFARSPAELAGTPQLQRLIFSVQERPVVAQIWGKDPEKFLRAAQLIKTLGFDGIDINMGCPDRAVLKQGCGAALTGSEHRGRVQEIIAATKEGASGLPVSVKTRLGNKKREEGWMEFLLEQQLAALTIHARLAKDMSLVPAEWKEIKKVVELRDSKSQAHVLDSRERGPAARVRFETSVSPRTLIIGNGDIKSMEDPRIVESGVDGVMIGRGVFENPWIFNNQETRNKKQKEDRMQLLRAHLGLWEQYWRNPEGSKKPYKRDYSIMKKFFKMYIRDFDGAAELRAKLMETKQVSEALNIWD